MTPHQIIKPLREQHGEKIKVRDITDIEKTNDGYWVEVRLFVRRDR